MTWVKQSWDRWARARKQETSLSTMQEGRRQAGEGPGALGGEGGVRSEEVCVGVSGHASTTHE